MRGAGDLRLHSEVSQMSTIEIPVELQVRGLNEGCIVNVWRNVKADSPKKMNSTTCKMWEKVSPL